MPDFVASILCLAFSMEVAYGEKQNKKVQFIVVREFSGDKTMREAFEQVIERQTCEQFEKWLEKHEIEQKAA